MKTSERHQLKTNEFAKAVMRARELFLARQRQVTGVVIAVLVVLVGLAGFTMWRGQAAARADALLAEAMALAEAPLTPPTGTPGETTVWFANETARAEAVLERLTAVTAAYPSTASGIAARYQSGSRLLQLGRPAEARAAFEDVVARAGTSLYGRMARLGLAEAHVLEGQFDAAIQIFRDLAAQQDGELPVDGLLMQLGRTYLAAGKPAEALQSFQRVLDEHPQSIYAGEARREAEAARVASGV